MGDLFEKLEIPRGSKRRVKERLKPYVKDQYACDLIDKLLSLDPSKRLDADNALNHDLFWTDPMPCSLERMLANHNQSMFEYLAPTRYTNSPKNLHVPLNFCHNRRNQQRAGGPMQ